MQYKYIIFDGSHAVCFSGAITHRDIACKGKIPTSAGFFTLQVYSHPILGEKVRVHVFGDSESLSLKFCDHDSNLIALALGIL